MSLPEDLHGYHALFKKLGSSVEISYKTYADVLERIFVEGNNDLHVNELRIAFIAMENFFLYISSDAKGKRIAHLDLKRLYLLSSEKKLVESNRLIFSDSEDIEKALKKTTVHFDFLVSLKGIDREKTSRCLKLLPEKFRPLFLSKIVKREADLTNLIEIEPDISGEVISFLNSPEFTNGIVRLICKERRLEKKEIPTDEEINVMRQKLQRVRVLFVENLETLYIHKSEVICKRPKFTHLDYNQDSKPFHCILYARYSKHDDILKWLQWNCYEIARIIRLCANTHFFNTSSLIVTMCLCIKDRNTIKPILTRSDIPALEERYAAPNNQLPVTGTFVPEKWITILDNKGLTFHQGDYVAVLVGVDSRGNREFKYAIVKEKMQSTDDQDHSTEDIYSEYMVEIAPNKTEMFRAYELFRFNRSIFSDTCKQSTPRLQMDNRALDDIFREIESTLRIAYSTSFPMEERIKICRRLMFQWHPDKNPDDVERATRVFQFIRTHIQNLEEEEEHRNSIEVNVPKPPQPDIFNDFDKCINRDQDIKNKPPQKESNPSEANRWLEQAKHDMRFAIESLTTDSHYNWICYICHQAAEKSLTAWQYFDDSTKVSNSENLNILHHDCPGELRRLARELQDLTGSVRRMRYPDNRHKPWSSYTRENAEKAIELATAMIDKVDETI
ncbi:sacsin-like [Saccostrea cucullata]|uniref:sacsin-like n=1 Tax=Saccostrea cuccullata TaxID=36930 RepID=UPI002ED5D581